MPDGNTTVSNGCIEFSFTCDAYHDKLRFCTLDMEEGIDVILAKPWHTWKNPRIDFRENTLSFDHRGKEIKIEANVHKPPSALNSATMNTLWFLLALPQVPLPFNA